jgi:hypothetical protein
MHESGSCFCAEEPHRIRSEFFETAPAAEEIILPFVLEAMLGGGWVYLHAAHWIYLFGKRGGRSRFRRTESDQSGKRGPRVLIFCGILLKLTHAVSAAEVVSFPTELH